MINLYQPTITKKDIKSVTDSLEKTYLSGNSPIVEDFEKKLAQICGTKYALACSNGTLALHLALISVGLNEGDEVIVPSLSYIASANAVKYFGGKPVFVDVNEDDWQINTDLIESKISKKTKAIMPVHLYGGVPKLNKISEIAKKYKLKIIHDCAESLGSLHKGKHSSSFRDVAIHSFFPNKLITTGEGGLLVTNNLNIYKKAKKIRSQGLRGSEEYDHDIIGYNYRMPAICAALGISQADKIESNLDKKKLIFERYIQNLEKEGIKFQKSDFIVSSSHWLTVIILPTRLIRNRLQEHLYANNIETRKVFKPLNLQKPYKNLESKNYYPISEKISNLGLCIPSSPNLSIDYIDYISNKIIEFIDS